MKQCKSFRFVHQKPSRRESFLNKSGKLNSVPETSKNTKTVDAVTVFLAAEMESSETSALGTKDMKCNTETQDESSLSDFIDVTLKAGRLIFFGASFSIVPVSGWPTKFVVRTHTRTQSLFRLIYIVFLAFLIVPFLKERLALSSCCLINFIKKGLHAVLLLFLITAIYCLEVKARDREGNGLVGIYSQCANLQEKFCKFGLHFPSRSKIRLCGWVISISMCIITLVRQYIFVMMKHPWYSFSARRMALTASLGLWAPSNETSLGSNITLGAIGICVESLIANYFYFVQFFHFSLVVTMWTVFNKLISGLKSGLLRPKHVPEIIDLHFESTKLLRLMNQLVSPLTFMSIVFDVTYLCFWTNYIADDWNFKPIYFAGITFFLKTTVELTLLANVNSKANEISDWLEECCTTSDAFPPIDHFKLTIFTSQVYSKESIGFKGLIFFVVTAHLVLAIAGIVVTYSFVVSQFCQLNNDSRT